MDKYLEDPSWERFSGVHLPELDIHDLVMPEHVPTKCVFSLLHRSNLELGNRSTKFGGSKNCGDTAGVGDQVPPLDSLRKSNKSAAVKSYSSTSKRDASDQMQESDYAIAASILNEDEGESKPPVKKRKPPSSPPPSATAQSSWMQKKSPTAAASSADVEMPALDEGVEHKKNSKKQRTSHGAHAGPSRGVEFDRGACETGRSQFGGQEGEAPASLNECALRADQVVYKS